MESVSTEAYFWDESTLLERLCNYEDVPKERIGRSNLNCIHQSQPFWRSYELSKKPYWNTV